MRFKLSLAFILLFSAKALCKKSTIRFLGFNLTSNPAYIKHCTGAIKPDRESLDIDLTVGRDQDPSMRSSISFSSNLLRHKNASDIHFDLPVCEIINNGMKAKSVIITNSLKNIFKQGTLPAKCPMLAGNYTWRDLRPRQEHMPTYLLGGAFRLTVRLYTKHDMADVHSRDVFVEKGGKVTIIMAIISFTLK